MEKLIPKIFAKIKKTPRDITAYDDLFSLCRNMEGENFKLAHETNKALREKVVVAMRQRYDVSGFFELYKKTLLFDAPHFLDPYLLYLEINRRPNERFYQPRRRVLKQVVDALQMLVDDELDELFISMPPRVGKTTILIGMRIAAWLSIIVKPLSCNETETTSECGYRVCISTKLCVMYRPCLEPLRKKVQSLSNILLNLMRLPKRKSSVGV